MRNRYKQIFPPLLLLMMLVTSGNAQLKKSSIKEAGHPKLSARSANLGDNVHGSLQDKKGDLWFVTWRVPNGSGQFQVEKVTYQPEAAGDYFLL